MTTVDLHVGRRTALEREDRPTLVRALADRGATVTFSRALEAYDLIAGSVQILRPRLRRLGVGNYEVETTPDVVEVEAIDAIRNIARVLGRGLPELNAPPVRALTEDKLSANRLLARLQLAKAFFSLDHQTALDAALDAVASSYVVVKPRHGLRSANIWIGTKTRLAALHGAGRINLESGWVVEEFLDQRVPLPIRSQEPTQQEQIDLANASGVPKELRMIVFGRDPTGALITSAVVRLGALGDHFLSHLQEDVWVTADPDSIPHVVRRGTDRIVRAVEEATSTPEIHLAVDWVLAHQMDSEPRWLPMEINEMPELMWEQDDLAAALDHTSKLADQLCRVAVATGASPNVIARTSSAGAQMKRP